MDESLALPLTILSGIQDGDNDNSTDGTLWQNVLVGICNMDEESFQVILDEFPCKNASSAKEAFIPNSSHRIRGKLQDCGSLADGLSSTMSEYRAGGEWELLLSETLLGACTDINVGRSKETKSVSPGTCSDPFELDQTKTDRPKDCPFVEAARWNRVLHSTVSAMVTATALLRLSLSGGKGRKPHRLATLDSGIDKNKGANEDIPLRHLADGECPSVSLLQSHRKPSVSKALSFLSEVESSGFVAQDIQRSAHAAAFHLVGSDIDLNNLVGMKVMRNSLLGIFGLSEATKDLESHEVSDGFVIVTEKLINTVDQISKSDGGVLDLNNQSASTSNLKMGLLSCLGFPYCKISIKTISELFMDARILLSNDFYSQNATFEWKWDTVQDRVIKKLVMISQGQSSIKLKAKGRTQAIFIVKELLNTEEHCIKHCVDSIEQDNTLKSFLLQWWNALAPDFIQELVGNDLCMRCPPTSSVISRRDKAHLIDLSRNFCSIIALLVGSISSGSESKTNGLKTWEIVLQCIRENLQYWARNPSLKHVLYLLCILAARFGQLKDVGVDLLSLSTFVDDLHNGSERVHVPALLESFYRFLRDVRGGLGGDLQDPTVGTNEYTNYEAISCDAELPSTKSKKSTYTTKAGESKLRNCTFVVTGGDFSEQHWYNCYTCGFVWDQGCCSLCAQICHRGHDVGYSRKSSFFCDCGAEGTANSNRPPCKCLSPLSDNDLAPVYESEVSSETTCAPSSIVRGVGSKVEDHIFWCQAIDIVVRCFPSFTQASLDSFVEDAKRSGLVQRLFDQFNSTFEVWERTDFSRSPWMLQNRSQHRVKEVEERAMNEPNHPLRLRSGKPLDITHLEEPTFSPIRAGTAHSLNPRLSTELSTDRLKKAVLSKNDIKRSIIAADYRGRLIVAEPSSLLFCAALPLINDRHVAKPLESHLERSQMCILGSAEVKFSVVGIALCPDRDRHLVVWGTSEVSVFLLTKSCDGVEAKIDLALGLDMNESENDYLLKAEWMLSSNGCVLLVFGATFVKIYDIRCSVVSGLPNDRCYSCRSAMRYTLAYEDIVIRSVTLIPSRVSMDDDKCDSEDVVVSSKIVLLFDTGRIHFIDLSLDCNGELEDQGESYIDCGDGLSFPTSGIRRSDEACAEPVGSTSKSLGEGLFLAYLSQSGVLVYKCVSSSLVAFTFDNDNKIAGSFELLPNVLNSKVLGMEDEGHSISGPYTHWTELGTVKRGNFLFYRASFVGRSTKTNQPRLLCIEFNVNETKVTEISWPAERGLGLGLSMSTYYEGVTAFSRPTLSKPTENNLKKKQWDFEEQVCLAVFTSNGSLLLYGEDLVGDTKVGSDNLVSSSFTPSKRRRAFSDSILSPYEKDFRVIERDLRTPTIMTKVAQPKFPLTIFETLVNVSEKEELVFGGDGVETEPEVAKRKVSITSSEFVISPSREGCTLTVRLRCENEIEKKSTTKDTKQNDSTNEIRMKSCDTEKKVELPKLAIVAVRILVGNTTKDFLPREVIVMGRPIKLTEKMKRWYDIPLTDEEIILGVRNGFVCIGIGASFDSAKNPPLVDAVEVYAQDRVKLSHLFPTAKVQSTLSPSISTLNRDGSTGLIVSEDESNKNLLNMSILSVTHVCRLLGKSANQSPHGNLKTLQRLIQITALDCRGEGDVRRHVIDLLKEVENDERARQMLLDEGTLLGISESLKDMSLSGVDESTSAPTKHDTDDVSMSDILEKTDVNTSGRFHVDHIILSALDDCITSALLIIKNRPANYRHCTENLIASNSIKSSVAVSSKAVLDLCMEQHFMAATAASKFVELATLEIVIYDSMSKSGNFAGLSMISDVLKSQDECVVNECCSTISNVLKKVPSQLLTGMDLDPNGTTMAYQCDGCQAVPITGTRYTLEERHNIDLCKTCFESGCNFAKTHKCQTSTPVLIHGKTLRLADREMKCDQIHHMRPVAIPDIVEEQVRQARAATEIDGALDEDAAALRMALDMSLETQNEDAESISSNLFAVRQKIFNGLLHDVARSLSADAAPSICNPIPIIDLLLSLVFQSNQGADQSTLWKKMSEVFCKNMSSLTESCLRNQVSKVSIKRKRRSLVLCLRALVCLLTKKELAQSNSHCILEEDVNIIYDAESLAVSEKNKEKTDPHFVCDVHGVPAVRRRCSHGEHKDRRFYVCGMERKQRCKYFKWASDKTKFDSTPSISSDCQTRKSPTSDKALLSSPGVDINSEMQSDLWTLFSSGSPPLQIQLCNLLQVYAKKLDSEETNGSVISMVAEGEPSSTDPSITKLLSCGGTKDENALEEDMEDGVLQSAQKLGPYFQGKLPKRSDFSDSLFCYSRAIAFPTSESSVVEASLDLLSLIAMDTLNPSTNPEAAWEGWYALLCEIMSTSASAHLRQQAKKMLQRLCGGWMALYHKVKDHYVFSFQFMSLIRDCEGPLQEALNVREKARRCGLNWGISDVTWGTLPSGGLIGVEDLVSENSHVVSKMEMVSKVLDELIDATKSRVKNWRQFCALRKIPHKSAKKCVSADLSLETDHSGALPVDKDICDRSPICLLLWMACSLPAAHQVKVFQLMDVALGSNNQDNDSMAHISDKSFEFMSQDCEASLEGHTQRNIKNRDNDESDSPEKMLLSGAGGLSIDDTYAFIVHFVLNGQGSPLRLVASSIARKLVMHSPRGDMDSLFSRLIAVCLRDIGPLGCVSIEFLQLMNCFVAEHRIRKSIDLSILSKVAVTYFTQQMTSYRDTKNAMIRNNTLTIEVGKDSGKARKNVFDLSSCVHCHRAFCGESSKDPCLYLSPPPSSEPSAKGGSSNKRFRSESPKISAQTKSIESSKMERSFTKKRLDPTSNTVSTEFSSHVLLKTRMTISEVHVSVGDPRGRFVKTIGVYFTPRHVNDINDLKTIEYKPLWQRCGTLSLARGAGRTTFKIANPIVAANLKFEYEDFYEKITGARSADGSLILHCPRCTRVVNNSHGVCGHCGEVAFQCRKCRHINYDRLDAFLCVECGYCASGEFAFEINSGSASKAVAIIDDDDLERAVRLLRIFSKKHSEFKALLSRKLHNAMSSNCGKSPIANGIHDLGGLSNYSNPLKRALTGELPKVSAKPSDSVSRADSQHGKKRSSADSSFSSSRRPNQQTHRSSAASKARSLLSLARQLRSEAGSGGDRSSRGDLLVQQALLNSSAGNSFEVFDESDGDMLGIINSSAEGNILQMDMPDPLSRLVANIQARVRGNTGRSEESEVVGESKHSICRGDDGSEGNNDVRLDEDSTKKSSEECDKLYQQMREAERDCYEVQRKIIAWKRLNKDALADFGSFFIGPSRNYVPVSCSKCASVVTRNILSLAMTVFGANMRESEGSLTEEFVSILFQESADLDTNLRDLKRAAIVTITIYSERGSRMVLRELKSRLRGSRDVASAEILGTLLERNFNTAASFEQLAIDTLSNRE